jgi:hypothetical protein
MMANADITVPAGPVRSAFRRLKQRSPLIRRLSETMRGIRAWVLLLTGLAVHAITGKTPKVSHLALVDVFIRTGGVVNDILSSIIAKFSPPYSLPAADGALGRLDSQALADIQRDLDRDGYRVFEGCLPAEMCDKLLNASLNAECLILGDEFVAAEPGKGRYDRHNPRGPKYLLTRDDTTDIEEVQKLLSDPSLIAVAQNYLHSKPIFSGISFWWSPPVKAAPDDNAAQQFHWDMERIRWLRFFIYLTDVTPGTGPHCFVSGSHRSNGIPPDMLSAGYVRHSDDSIIQRYGPDAYREFTGVRGTIIAEDSRGFHKGKMPVDGDRLILAFELSNTTFGVNKRHRIRNIRSARFGNYAKRFPRLYANFDFDRGTLR